MYYNDWTSSNLKKIGQEYYIVQGGILSKHDFKTIEDEKIGLPIENIELINVYSNITFDKCFFEEMNNKGIIVSIFDRHSEFIGSFIPANHTLSTSLSYKQLTIFNSDKRIIYAKEILLSSMHNIIEVLSYYKIEDKNIIKNIYTNIENSNTIEQLLIYEAKARYYYYKSFNKIIKNPDFYFKKRSKRPPKDYINALISFGNSILYRIIAKEIYKTKLDIKIGFIHSNFRRNESLNLDISELFKPIIVDRVIFKLINKNMITKIHFNNEKDGCFLSDEGKRIFLEQFEEKLSTSLKIDNHNYTYKQILNKELINLSKSLNNDSSYKAYRYYR